MEQLRVDFINSQPGTLKDYDCPICKNRGYTAELQGDRMIFVECDCTNRRKALRRMSESGLKPILELYRMDNFKTDRKWQLEAKSKALKFIENGKGWFVIAGNPGTGKTHLCTAICGRFLEQGRFVRYMVWREEAPKLKASVTDRDVYEKAMKEFKQADVLYIDDFWKGNVTEADINLSFELLNSRYNDQSKITIISGEKDVEQMLSIDEAIGSRIYERSKGFLIKTPNENYRLR